MLLPYSKYKTTQARTRAHLTTTTPRKEKKEIKDKKVCMIVFRLVW